MYKSAMRMQTVVILQSSRTTNALRLPRDVNRVAMEMGKVEQGSGMAGVKYGLNNN
jgi:hypothetical protein